MVLCPLPSLRSCPLSTFHCPEPIHPFMLLVQSAWYKTVPCGVVGVGVIPVVAVGVAPRVGVLAGPWVAVEDGVEAFEDGLFRFAAATVNTIAPSNNTTSTLAMIASTFLEGRRMGDCGLLGRVPGAVERRSWLCGRVTFLV